MKRIFSVFCLVCIMLTCSTSRLDAQDLLEDDLYISFEEMTEIVTDLCNDYDIVINFQNENEVTHFLKADVYEELAILEESLQVDRSPNYTVEYVEIPTGIQPFFRYSKEYISYVYLSNSTFTGAEMEFKFTATIYDGTMTFVSISNITSRQYGIGNFFKSWTPISSNYTISRDKKTATVETMGTLVTEYNFLGVLTTYTYDHVIGRVIHVS